MSFKDSLSIEVELEEVVSQEARATVFAIQRGLIKATPVGNPDLWVYNHPTRGYIDYIGYLGEPEGYVGGRARSNWFVYLGNKTEDVTKNTDASLSISSANQAIAKAKGVEYPTMGVINNLPYIERLNDGHSTQAPKKFVEEVISRVVNSRKSNGR